jgi:hypothetical protein
VGLRTDFFHSQARGAKGETSVSEESPLRVQPVTGVRMSKLTKASLAAAVVIVAAGALLVFTFAGRNDGTATTQRHKAETDLVAFSTLVHQFYDLNHRFPSNDEGLDSALRFGAGANGLTNRHPLDPWGHPYVYRATPGGPPQLYSIGPNGVDENGAGDDISAKVQ